MKSILLSFPVLIVLSAMLYVRLTPQDIAELHMRLEFSMDETQTGGVKRRIEGDILGLHKLTSQESRSELPRVTQKKAMSLMSRDRFFGDFLITQLFNAKAVIYLSMPARCSDVHIWE